jgi:hypothetical protein
VENQAEWLLRIYRKTYWQLGSSLRSRMAYLKHCTEIPGRLRTQCGNEVAQFVLDLGGRCHRLRDFFA